MIAESEDYFCGTLRNQLEKQLATQSCVSDAALFYRKLGALVGLCATYVDDTLHAGNKA